MSFFVYWGCCESAGIAQQCAVRYGAPEGAEHDQREYPAYLHQKGNDGKRRRFSFYSASRLSLPTTSAL